MLLHESDHHTQTHTRTRALAVLLPVLVQINLTSKTSGRDKINAIAQVSSMAVHNKGQTRRE